MIGIGYRKLEGFLAYGAVQWIIGKGQKMMETEGKGRGNGSINMYF